MSKLYYASLNIDVVFCSPYPNIKDEAVDFLNAEIETNYLHGGKLDIYLLDKEKKINIKELESVDDVPLSWRRAIYWGQNEFDDTPISYFDKHSKEKEEFEKAKSIYLSLKDKYEK